MRLRFDHNENNHFKSLVDRPVSFDIIQYDDLHYIEHHFNTLSELKIFLSKTSCTNSDYCTWLNLNGIHRNDLVNDISLYFNLHPLIEEDICTINERMKIDLLDNGSSIYLLMKMIYINPHTQHVQQEQISFVLQENNFLLTFQEARDPSNSFDLFQIIKHRLQNNRGRIRSLKIDYLFYCLFDILIENYMIVLDRIGLRIDLIDRLLMKKLKTHQKEKHFFDLEKLQLIYLIKHDMLSLKILCQPLREIIIKLQKAQDRIAMITKSVHSRRQYRRKKRPKHISLSGNYFFNPNSDSPHRRWSLGHTTQDDKSPLFNEYIFLYFKDLNDHIIQLRDRIDTFCDLLSSLTSFYMILNQAEINQIMTFLMLVSVTFIPLTFLNGLFSMNYHNTPPLKWHYGYFMVLTTLAVLAILMISIFKWKKWL